MKECHATRVHINMKIRCKNKERIEMKQNDKSSKWKRIEANQYISFRKKKNEIRKPYGHETIALANTDANTRMQLTLCQFSKNFPRIRWENWSVVLCDWAKRIVSAPQAMPSKI